MLSKTLEGSEDSFSYASHRNKAMLPQPAHIPRQLPEEALDSWGCSQETVVLTLSAVCEGRRWDLNDPHPGFSCAAQPGPRNSSQHMASR